MIAPCAVLSDGCRVTSVEWRRAEATGLRARGLACLLLLCLTWMSVPEAHAAVPQAADVIDLSDGWRFRPDPERQGGAAGWFAPGMDDSHWAVVKTGESWKGQGFPAVDGWAWYRRWAYVPDTWQRVVVGFGAVDLEADLYCNGTYVAHYDGQHMGPAAGAADLTALAPPGRMALLAFRVDNHGGYGGIKQRVLLGRSPAQVMSPRQYALFLQQANPGWALPGWAAGGPMAWTIAGTGQGGRQALVSADGRFSPAGDRYSLGYWVYDHTTGQFAAPEQLRPQSSLRRGFLPIVHHRWALGDVRAASTLLVTRVDGLAPRPWWWPLSVFRGERAGDVALSQLEVQNGDGRAHDLSIYLVLRPFGVHGDVAPVRRAGFTADRRALVADGQVAAVARQGPSAVAALATGQEDLSDYAARGALPDAEQATDPEGYVSAAFAFRRTLPPGASYYVQAAVPLAPTQPLAATVARLGTLDFDQALDDTTAWWANRLGQVQLRLPEERYAQAFYASLAYLLIGRDAGRLLPGPLAHHAFWYRDSAYMALALERAGLLSEAAGTVDSMAAYQQPDGEFPPVVSPDGTRREDQEWDSQGEALFSFVERYRLTRDRAWLARVYPAIRRGAAFLERLQAEGDAAPGEARGLLPPSKSAEDLGSPYWHHYFDDFWAIAGLRAAADAATQLGHADDAARFTAQAERLQAAVQSSATATMARAGTDFIPNGPEDTASSAAARGTTALLWPGRLAGFDPALVRASFQRYYERFVQPQRGGFAHYEGTLWPFGGLELAHGFLFLGMRRPLWEVVDWTLDHQTLPGAFAWADAVDPRGGSLAVGDMPHGWVAAEYVNLLRDMLLYEDGDRVRLASGVLQRWLDGGRSIEVANAPTYFGRVGYRLRALGGAPPEAVELTLTGAARPPGGFLLDLPLDRRPTRATVDGRPAPVQDDGTLLIPADARAVRLEYGA